MTTIFASVPSSRLQLLLPRASYRQSCLILLQWTSSKTTGPLMTSLRNRGLFKTNCQATPISNENAMLHCHLLLVCVPCPILRFTRNIIVVESQQKKPIASVLQDMSVLPWTTTDATNAERLFLILTTYVPIAKLISAPNHSNAIESLVLVQHASGDSLKSTISSACLRKAFQNEWAII